MMLECVLPFDCDEPEFARGFEAGRVWGLLNALPEEEITAGMHATNAEMALRMAEATNRKVRSTEYTEGDGTFIEITYAPVTDG